MKRILLPLLSATSFLTVLAPQADAAAITGNQVSLNPRLIGAGKLQRRFNHGIPASIFNTTAPVSASAASLEEFLANAIASGAITKSGAGTLMLNGGTLTANANQSEFIGGLTTTGNGTLTITGGSINFGTVSLIGGDLNPGSGSVNVAGSGILTLGGGGGVLTGNAWLSSGTLSGSIVTGADQTLTPLNLANNQGAVLLLNGGNVVAPTVGGGEIAGGASPVPEPGTAMLFALGMLAASQVRRRRA